MTKKKNEIINVVETVGLSDGIRGYYGITYDENGKFDCSNGIHKLDEVWSVDSHYLVCDDCQLMIRIAEIDDKYVKGERMKKICKAKK